MENTPSYRSLLRLFYQYQNDKLLFFKEHKLCGIIEKKQIEELMSDLSHAQHIEEIPYKAIENIDDALMALLKSNVSHEGQKALPVVDDTGKFLGLWTKSEILNSVVKQPAFKTLPEKHQKPMTSGAKAVVKDNLSGNLSTEEARPSVKIHVTDAVIKEKPEINPPRNTSENRHEISTNDYISIKTLEALPIPMLALDTKGNVLFYNQDWVDLQKKNKDTLGVKNLMNMGRDLMAKMAFDGNLEINSILLLPLTVNNFEIKMKSILNDGEQIAKVLGYIFWAENSPAKPKEEPKAPAKKKDKPPESENTHNMRDKYLGKTLVEILREEEKKIMEWAMDEANQNQSNAAMLLGIPRQTFSYRYHKLFTNTMSQKLK